jgi:hypothetical protein
VTGPEASGRTSDQTGDQQEAWEATVLSTLTMP